MSIIQVFKSKLVALGSLYSQYREILLGHDSTPPKAGVQNRSDESCPKIICFFPLTVKGPTPISSNANFCHIKDFWSLGSWTLPMPLQRGWMLILARGSLARKKGSYLLILKPIPKSASLFFPLHIAVFLFPNFRGSCHLEPHSMPFYQQSSKCSPYFLRHFPSSAAFSWVHLSLAAAFHHPICCLASAYVNHFSAWKSL